MKIFYSVAPFPKINPISQCIDTRNKTKCYLIKCRHQQVCLQQLSSIIYFCITLIIFMCRFFKVMFSSYRTESSSKYTSIIITDHSTTTRAAHFNVSSSKTEKTGVWNKDWTDHQSANSNIVINESRTINKLDIW